MVDDDRTGSFLTLEFVVDTRNCFTIGDINYCLNSSTVLGNAPQRDRDLLRFILRCQFFGLTVSEREHVAFRVGAIQLAGESPVRSLDQSGRGDRIGTRHSGQCSKGLVVEASVVTDALASQRTCQLTVERSSQLLVIRALTHPAHFCLLDSTSSRCNTLAGSDALAPFISTSTNASVSASSGSSTVGSA
ncbi:hypothetical protein ACIBCN_42545 [Nocardia sp. NPDC051052]|uniref:hypothetical protein n=1 Tax=Nocardia sp. NPDC051052 TaxID=3364322 RepID=UPI003787E41D